MKNITCTNDNVLIKATIKKSIIVLPNAKDNKKLSEGVDIEKIEVIKIGDKVKDNMPSLQMGDLIIIDTNALSQPNFNSEIGAPSPIPDMQQANFYFFIKVFQIIAIIK